MARPNEKKILAAIRTATDQLFKIDKDSLTVRAVRTKVTDDLELDEEFFQEDEWKQKSKDFIKEYAAQLISAEEEKTQAENPSPEKSALPLKRKAPAHASAPASKGKKRASPVQKAPSAKRRKKQATPSDISDDEELSDVSLSEPSPEESEEEASFGESESDEPKPKKKGRGDRKIKSNPRGQAKTRKKAAVSEDEDEDEDTSLSDTPSSIDKAASEEPTPPPLAKKKKEPANPPVAKKSETAPKPEPEADAESSELTPAVSTKDGAESESEMSVVLDEAPTKKKRAPKGSFKESKSSKAKPAAVPKPAKDLSPDEALLKTLQTQLKKCGIKKIYQFELKKKFDDDVKAKIKYLQKELRDVGMQGRFSESRAKEIKEQRELLDDLEAVKEGDQKWGMESKGRASRAKAKKNFKETSSGDEDADGSGNKSKSQSRSGSEAPPPPRAARARQDLAFLDDDDEDSD